MMYLHCPVFRGRSILRACSPLLNRSASRAFCSRHDFNSVADQGDVDNWEDNCRGSDNWLRGPRDADWWTGPQPFQNSAHSLPFQDLTQASRADMQTYFDNTWLLTDTLFAALQGEEPFYRPPYHELRHPLIFYYGHPACFYINKLRLAGLLDHGIEPYFESIFEVGVDEMRWDDLSKNHKAWPSVKDVHAYRKEVYRTVCEVIQNAPGIESLKTDLTKSSWWSIPMGFEHERIHIETSSVLMRELPIHLVRQPESWPSLALSNTSSTWQPPKRGVNFPENSQVSMEAGTVTLGRPWDENSYGWDNEYGSKTMATQPFTVSQMQITNGDFYEFVASGGYRDQSLWSAEGWGWACFRNIRAPTFWVRDGPNGLNQYKLRTPFKEVPMQWDWPAIVNYHEAKAYCAWLTQKHGNSDAPFRIMTEAEHHRIREDTNEDTIMTTSPAENFNFKHGAERSVNAGPPNSKGFYEVFGNAWEWCEDHQAPLPGFEIFPLYDDFTLPCFDGEHQLIVGGSFASTGNQGSKFARYQFRPHFFQHASFRVTQPQGTPWLQTSCMESQGPYAGAQSPYRSPEDFVSPPADLTGTVSKSTKQEKTPDPTMKDLFAKIERLERVCEIQCEKIENLERNMATLIQALNAQMAMNAQLESKKHGSTAATRSSF